MKTRAKVRERTGVVLCGLTVLSVYINVNHIFNTMYILLNYIIKFNLRAGGTMKYYIKVLLYVVYVYVQIRIHTHRR